MSPYTPHTESNASTGLENLDLYKKPDAKILTGIPDDYKPLSELKIDDELAKIYSQATSFLANIGYTDTPANQVAQVINTISTILKEISKTQTDLYNAERSKRIEAAVIQAIKVAPKESQDIFFDEYERILKGAK